MRRPYLIIVSGPPASGKSTVAQRLSARLGLPIVAKDDIKEQLFDAEIAAAPGDRSDLSRRAAIAAFERTRELLAGGESVLLEGNWRAADHGAAIARLVQEHRPEVVQIQCIGAGERLLERFMARARAGRRHPVHSDLGTLPRLREELLRGRYEPLALPGSLLEIDTTSADDRGAWIDAVLALVQC